MPTNRRKTVSATRVVGSAILVVVALFLLSLSLGLGSWQWAAVAVALGVAGVALYVVSVLNTRAFTFVPGSGQVLSASPAPNTAAALGRCHLHLVVRAPGVRESQVKIRDSGVPLAKWPVVGAQLPVIVARDDPRRVRVLWDQVLPEGAEATDEYVPSRPLATDADYPQPEFSPTPPAPAQQAPPPPVPEPPAVVPEPAVAAAASVVAAEAVGVAPAPAGPAGAGPVGAWAAEEAAEASTVHLARAGTGTVAPERRRPSPRPRPTPGPGTGGPGAPADSAAGPAAPAASPPGAAPAGAGRAGSAPGGGDGPPPSGNGPAGRPPGGGDGVAGAGRTGTVEEGRAEGVDGAGTPGGAETGAGAPPAAPGGDPAAGSAGGATTRAGATAAAATTAATAGEAPAGGEESSAADAGPPPADAGPPDGNAGPPVGDAGTPGADEPDGSAEPEAGRMAAAGSGPDAGEPPTDLGPDAGEPPTDTPVRRIELLVRVPTPLRVDRVLSPARPLAALAGSQPASMAGADEPLVVPSAEEVAEAYLDALPGRGQTRPGRGGVTLFVSDLDRALDFYRDVLGLTEVTSGPGGAVLAGEGGQVTLRRAGRMPPVDRRLVYLLLEVADVDQAYGALRSRGVPFVHRPRRVAERDHAELWSTVLRGPDGHGLALIGWRTA